jgi:hypothetical protein
MPIRRIAAPRPASGRRFPMIPGPAMLLAIVVLLAACSGESPTGAPDASLDPSNASAPLTPSPSPSSSPGASGSPKTSASAGASASQASSPSP